MLELFPGLRSLRAFDAAARHLSFTRAASDMGVTPAAISHQIKELEEQIGVSLFARTSRSVTLTPAGAALLPHVRQLLQDAQALPDLARRAAAGESGRRNRITGQQQPGLLTEVNRHLVTFQ